MERGSVTEYLKNSPEQILCNCLKKNVIFGWLEIQSREFFYNFLIIFCKATQPNLKINSGVIARNITSISAVIEVTQCAC